MGLDARTGIYGSEGRRAAQQDRAGNLERVPHTCHTPECPAVTRGHSRAPTHRVPCPLLPQLIPQAGQPSFQAGHAGSIPVARSPSPAHRRPLSWFRYWSAAQFADSPPPSRVALLAFTQRVGDDLLGLVTSVQIHHGSLRVPHPVHRLPQTSARVDGKLISLRCRRSCRAMHWRKPGRLKRWAARPGGKIAVSQHRALSAREDKALRLLNRSFHSSSLSYRSKW